MKMIETLTESEELVMKAFWDTKKAKPCLSDIVHQVNTVYGKDWKPQTVSTFFTKLIHKGYLKMHREGKFYWYSIHIKEEDYRVKKYRTHISLWNGNDPIDLIRDMVKHGDITLDDLEKIMKNLEEEGVVDESRAVE